MESRWYLPPGGTLENTKIEDRKLALHITADEYEHIKRHLDRNKAINEMLEMEESKRKYLAEGSRNMIKNWDNSLENIAKRKEEERLRRIEANRLDKLQRFFNIKEEQEAVRKEYVDKIKKKMFRTTGISRDLTSAFRLSEVLYERGKQNDFKQFIKEHEDEEDAEYAKYVNDNAKQEFQEKKEKAENLYKEKKQYGKYLRSVIEENAANIKHIKDTTKSKEIQDNIRSIEEMAIIKRKEEERILEKKKEIKLALHKHMQAERERQAQLEEEEKEKDEVVAIIQAAKHKIECLRKDKEKELQDAIIARREEVAKLVVASEAERNALEEKQLREAIAERDALEQMKMEKKIKYQAKIRKERLEDRERCILREKEAQRKATEVRKWEMLNRYKNDEITKIYDENRKKAEWNKILEYRKVLFDQMDENEKERLREKEINDFNAVKCFDGEDAQFFDYADEVMELAKRTGRSTYPIEKVIMDYKKINRLKVPVCELSNCEDYAAGRKISRSREIANTTKQRPCKCNNRKP